MNKITKRIVAGASALALLASAVGVEQLADMFMKTSYAEGYVGKNALSTGFSNLEQDTNKDGYYNTGYGLHTNKTATALDDGRTFDVNLESWYVGENPVDVATILDASGSMAWTVNTLDPMEVNEQLTDTEIAALKDKYSITNDELAKYIGDTYEKTDEKTKVLLAIQEKNKGYLPQEVIDLILDHENTDDTKLSYAGYKYYVYEARSSVSEFVPLGYWDGGADPKNDDSLIGYYPFSGDLKNKAPKATDGAAGMLINHPASGSTSYENKEATEKPQGVFANGEKTEKGETKYFAKGLNIADSMFKGAILVANPTTDNFSISFKMTIDQNENGYNEATILYITDGTNYYRIFRGGDNSPNRLKITAKTATSNNKTLLNANKATNSEPRDWKFTFDFKNKQLKITTSTENVVWDSSNTGQKEYTVDLTDYPTLNKENLKIYIGGNTNEPTKTVDNIYIRDLIISDIGDDGAETEVANYPLDTKENGFKNTVNTDEPAYFVEQAYKSTDKTFGTAELATHKLEAQFTDDSKALDLNATSKLGAVMLDAVPDIDSENGFTISMKLKKTGSLSNNQQNIFYLGDKNTGTNNYYQFMRSKTKGGALLLRRNDQTDTCDKDHLYYQGGLVSNDTDYINTLVFENLGDGNFKVTPYVNGKPAEIHDGQLKFPNGKEKDGSTKYGDYNAPESIQSITVSKENLVFLLGALQKNDDGSDHYLDDLYVFNSALTETQVAQYFGEKNLCDGTTSDKKLYHATTLDNEDIAQISESLANNTKSDERRGWYYVNSHSTWADVTGCLASGKQYIGIFTDDGLKGDYDDMAKDTATIPAGFAESEDENQRNIAAEIAAGDTGESKYSAPSTERSILFYVDRQNHLRCFVWTGDATKSEDNARTFCSLVYEKKDDQLTKYEELNSALNSFYQNLAAYSDLSNTSVVRFSTNSAVDKDNVSTTNKNLQKLIMKDWTNWSDAYLKEKATDKTTYLQNLLIPEADDENATYTTKSTARGEEILEYPYVMTGGTYTWTGLKAFYDNMVKKDDLKSGDRVYDVANDARDKYLIIFTDGRDNTQDYNVSITKSTDEGIKLAGSPDYDNISGTTFGGTKYVDTYNPYKDDKDHKVGFSIENYDDYKGEKTDYYYNECQVQEFKTGDHTIQYDGDLAQAWADKLKDEGYTIYCVMLATGSISSTANADEYNKAKNFLKSLSGGEDVDKEIAEKQADMDSWGSGTKPDEYAKVQREIEALKDNYVIVVDPSKDGGMTVTDAFQKILDDIQKPRNDYTVQDYIDPRFNLIGKAYKKIKDSYEPIEVIYHLGANGTVTFTDTDNKLIETEDDHIYFDNAYGSKTSYSVSGVTVGDIIDISGANGLAYTPQNSYMVNRSETTDTKSEDGYDWGDRIGTGYLYYDDEKDMYYLRWEDQVIPMEDKAFDTDTSTPKKYLDVWSATIRLKAKDDFIGGNNILTNGNEAGENLVYSDATIENMDKNPQLYFTAEELREYTTAGKINIPYRKKLEVLSGTDRKINAVDAGGVSQAVYGDGIDIPSSGFPRTTVNVRLLKLDAKNLNDVIYMGEVVSPTMMLADLENGYMTGSYYLQYLERYAYRLYGKDTDKTPLLDLLNEWLKIDDKDEMSKTFTIPYIYLPAPIYKNGKLQVDKDTNKVIVSNNTGASWDTDNNTNFTDLNLRDVTGFITYTWKRVYKEGEERESQQKVGDNYDITLDYVVKNTNQIKYDLELKFTPLHEGGLVDSDGTPLFTLEKEQFIKPKEGKEGDKFFNVDTDESSSTYNEFVKSADEKWVFTNRSEYLKAMIKEERTYTPHVEYNSDSGKWKLIAGTSVEKTDKGVYDWDKEYKPVAGKEQIETGEDDNYYTNTPKNVAVSSDGYSLVANTTYTKDVVNAALALEIYVDGKYLQSGMPMAKRDTFTFEATRYYNDPLDPLPYGDDIDADTGDVSSSGNVGGKKYRLTFTYEVPEGATPSEICRVWAELTKVEVEKTAGSGDYELITTADGYAVKDALPIGTYEISVKNSDMESAVEASQYYLGTAKDESSPGHFRYLKIENDVGSYTHDRFPTGVVTASADAVTDTGDKEYQIWNEKSDYSKANIAKNNRVKDGTNQTVTFYFGTVKDGIGKKGVSRTELKEGDSDYAKDRLGIIMLSASANSLAITKEVTKAAKPDFYKWDFTVTVTPEAGEAKNEFIDQNGKGFKLTWYKLSGDGSWQLDSTLHSGEALLKFSDDDGDGTYTATVSLKHHEKVVIGDLSEGTWQVKEETVSGVLYTPHNDQYIYGEDEWQYKNAAETRANIELSPASQVNYVNEFPHELPSTGGSGIVRLIFLGSAFTLCSVMLFAILWYNCRKRRTMKK